MSVSRDGVPDLGHLVELGGEARDKRRLEPGEQLAEARHGGERGAQRHEIARPGGAEGGAGHEPLDVVHGPQRVAELAALGRAEREVLDGVEAIADPLEREQRADEPRAEQARAHRRHRAVEFVEQGTGAAAVDRLDDLEVLQRERVHDQPVGVLLERDAAQVREVGLLRVLEIVDQGAGRPHGGRVALEAEPLEGVRPELREQRAAGGCRHRTPTRPAA